MLSRAHPIAVSLDCRGALCPVPVIRTRKALAALAPGEILEVIATDPGSKGDFVAFAKNTGHELLASEEEPRLFRYYLRKAG